MMLDNPYRYLKSPPFNSVTILTQSEGPMGGVNNGVVYIQNASPSGPAVWIVASTGAPPPSPLRAMGKRRASSAHANLAHPAVDYLLRVYEDMPWFTEHFPPNVHTWDQARMDDMVRVEHCARAHAQPAPSPHARVGCVCRWSRWARAMWFRGRCWERTLPTQHKASEPLLVPWKHASGSQTSLFHWSPAQTTGSQCEGNVAGAARLALRSARAAWRQRRD